MQWGCRASLLCSCDPGVISLVWLHVISCYLCLCLLWGLTAPLWRMSSTSSINTQLCPIVWLWVTRQVLMFVPGFESCTLFVKLWKLRQHKHRCCEILSVSSQRWAHGFHQFTETWFERSAKFFKLPSDLRVSLQENLLSGKFRSFMKSNVPRVVTPSHLVRRALWPLCARMIAECKGYMLEMLELSANVASKYLMGVTNDMSTVVYGWFLMMAHWLSGDGARIGCSRERDLATLFLSLSLAVLSSSNLFYYSLIYFLLFYTHLYIYIYLYSLYGLYI